MTRPAELRAISRWLGAERDPRGLTEEECTAWGLSASTQESLQVPLAMSRALAPKSHGTPLISQKEQLQR